MFVNDGSIRVGTKLDTSGIESDLNKLNQQLQNTSQKTQNAVNKILNGKQMKGLEKEINSANNGLSKTQSKLQEIEKELAKIQAQTDKDLKFATTDAQTIAVLEMEEMQTKELRMQQQLLNDEVKKYKMQLESANTSKKKLVDTAKSKMQVGIIQDSVNKMNSFGNSVDKGIKKMLRLGIAVYGIRGIFTILSRAATTYMNNNEGVRQSIQGVWNALGELLGPVIQWVTGLLLKLIGYLDVFIQALTGVSIIARANANALQKQASSLGDVTDAQNDLNKAQRQQAGFDEQNVLSDNSSGSGGSSGGSTGGITGAGGIDMSGVELDPNVVEGIRKFGEICKDVFGWIKDNWKIVVIALAGITAGIIAFNVATAICQLLLIPVNGTILLIVAGIALLIAIITAVILYWDELGVIAGKCVDWIKEKWEQFTNWLSEIITSIGEWFDNLVDNIIKGISKFCEDCENFFIGLRDGIYKAWGVVSNWFNEKIITPIKTFFKNLTDGIVNGFKAGIDWIKNAFSIMVNWISGYVISPIRKFFNELFESIKSGPRGFANFVIEKLEWMINKIIDGFNYLIRQLNKVSFNTPDWIPGIGGKKFGFNINQLSYVSLPRLAKGGIVNNPGKGVPLVAGELGREMILPLDNNTEWMDILVGKMGGNVTIPIYLNGKKIAEEVININNKKDFARGGL